MGISFLLLFLQVKLLILPDHYNMFILWLMLYKLYEPTRLQPTSKTCKVFLKINNHINFI